jgi:hypothetical protein
MTPLRPRTTDATPLTKVSFVGVPNATAVPAESVMVGGVTGEGDEAAPENVRSFDPVYEVAGWPELSALIVKF